MKNNNEIFKEIVELDSYFQHSKKFFRFIEDPDIGKYETQPYNLGGNFKFIMKFTEPISVELQFLHSKVGHYLNQNYLIRLYEILKHYKIASKNIDRSLKGSDEIENLWKLRKKFANGLGKYDSADSKDRELLNQLITRFNEKHIVKDEFPISQDKTIKEIIHGIKSYLYQGPK